VIAAVLALALQAAPPTYLAERVVTVGQQVTRVSVFRDGTAVVALRDGLGEPRIIRQKLHGVEMQVLLQVLDECYDDLARVRPPGYAPGGSWVEWRIAPPGRDPLIVRLPQAGTPLAVVVRLAQALDGIENRLIEEPGGREDLSKWMPATGDRVLLVDGRTVEVRSVSDSSVGPLVAVQVVDNPIRQVFTLEELRLQAVRRVKP
jgi:hypothetical protein